MELYDVGVGEESHWDPAVEGLRGAGAGLWAPRREKDTEPELVGQEDAPGPATQCRQPQRRQG